jgi:hypothetical protein
MLEYSNKIITFYKREGIISAFKRAYPEFAFVLDIPWLRYSWMLPGSTNEKEMRIFALRRSGHHAIINWIMYQVKGRYCFLNDCKGSGNPLQTCLRVNSKIASRLAEHNRLFWDREITGKLSKKGTLLYNYEDQSFAEVLDSNLEMNREKWIGRSKNTNDILILRDPFNLLASKLKWAYGDKKALSLDSFPRIIEIWKEQAREFLGETNYLRNKILINYNFWFTSKEYRLNLAEKLGLGFDDKGVHEIAKWGPTTWKNASFDGLKFDGNATKMKVLDRWKNFQDDEFFRKLISDEELLVLSERIFDEIPGIKQILI